MSSQEQLTDNNGRPGTVVQLSTIRRIRDFVVNVTGSINKLIGEFNSTPLGPHNLEDFRKNFFENLRSVKLNDLNKAETSDIVDIISRDFIASLNERIANSETTSTIHIKRDFEKLLGNKAPEKEISDILQKRNYFAYDHRETIYKSAQTQVQAAFNKSCDEVFAVVRRYSKPRYEGRDDTGGRIGL